MAKPEGARRPRRSTMPFANPESLVMNAGLRPHRHRATVRDRRVAQAAAGAWASGLLAAILLLPASLFDTIETLRQESLRLELALTASLVALGLAFAARSRTLRKARSGGRFARAAALGSIVLAAPAFVLACLQLLRVLR